MNLNLKIYEKNEDSNNKEREIISDGIDEEGENEINEEEKNYNISNNNMNIIKEKHEQKLKRKSVVKIIKYLIENNLFPATLFVFNIRKIKEYSSMFLDKENINILKEEEKQKINKFFEQTISCIPKEEQNIPQINYVRQILQIGIGVHHSGLLPILKEIIEILYFHGLIKILFATTSFSIGLNMPTRTVVFTSLYKYHEDKRQLMNSSEFLQMSGRAGRRGKDKVGNVYILFTQPQSKHEFKVFKNILKGEGNDLESKFRLSYRIILSFYHRNVKNIKDFFQESFHESHNIEIRPERMKEIYNSRCEINNKKIINCVRALKAKKIKIDDDESNYIDIEDSPISHLIYNTSKCDLINQNIFSNEKIVEYLEKNPGTILKIKYGTNSTMNKFHNSEFAMLINILNIKNHKKLWCLTILSYQDNKSSKKEEDLKEKELNGDSNKKVNKGQYKEYKFKYLLINSTDIIEIFEKPKVALEPFFKENKIKDFFDIDDKMYHYFKKNDKSLYLALKYFYREINNYFPKKRNEITKKLKNNTKIIEFDKKKVKILNYKNIIENNCEDENIYIEKNELGDKINNSPCDGCNFYVKHLEKYKQIYELNKKINAIKSEIINGEKIEIYKKFDKRLNLLKELEYIQLSNNSYTENNNNNKSLEKSFEEVYTLTLKGQASLEIISNDSILITEMLVSNIFKKDNEMLSTGIIVAFLCSFVNNSKKEDLSTEIKLEETKDNEEIKYLMEKFHNIYDKLIGKEKELELEESVYNRNFCFKYFNPVYSWIKGESFGEVCNKYELVEGKLYTFILRCYYFTEEISRAYKRLGNEELSVVFSNIKNSLLKGIMSVESLYIQENIDINDI